ncbi:MAG: class II fructose-bisphosphate aldolase [Candidatus Omnitrophica bacterium]|nr:class II fructose-bisphosphate aldolase [Candidatus Omnitrophota bacterium]MCM8793394.1 class II fructose-bisphosphate aldolase [Candidatus Omnitrophota bacterium]
MIYQEKAELYLNLEEAISVTRGKIKIKNAQLIKEKFIDDLVETLCLSSEQEVKDKVFEILWSLAQEAGVFPFSIQKLYEARGRGKVGGFTVPAINLRGLTYDLARAVIRTAMKTDAGAFIFEIARSEIGYTDQRPQEYAGVCIASAIKEGYRGPIFIQGDHFQVNAKKYKENPEKELQGLRELIREAVQHGFYNIDIDSSTLVDLSQPTVKEQQRLNFEIAGEMTKLIREIQPRGLDISLGAEIGEVGGKNSTPEELMGFMEGYLEFIGELKGISKISVQTGTTHGGVVLPDGTVAKVKLDFDTLKTLSQLAREKYKLAGAVQHGASTLPPEAFHKFPETETAEVHLATEFQNMIFDSKHFPQDLKERIYSWIRENLSGEREEGQTDEQFYYKTRKKAFGQFKKELMSLSADIRSRMREELEAKFEFLFKELRVTDTKEIVEKFVKPKKLPCPQKREVKKEVEKFEGGE